MLTARLYAIFIVCSTSINTITLRRFVSSCHALVYLCRLGRIMIYMLFGWYAACYRRENVYGRVVYRREDMLNAK
jgi:hypothetical protein